MKLIIPITWILSVVMTIFFFVMVQVYYSNNENKEVINIFEVFFLLGLILAFSIYLYSLIQVITRKRLRKCDEYSFTNDNKKGIEYRESFDVISLIYITLGIYLFYWMYKITEELKNEPTPTKWEKNGTDVMFLMIVTFGVYYGKWARSVSEALIKENKKELLLEMCGRVAEFPFSSVSKIQRKINEIIDGKAGNSDYNLIYKKYSKK